MNTLAVAALFCALGADAPDYTKEVLPVLEKRCAGCHNETDREGQFSVHSLDAIMKGGEHGAVLTPGQTASSRMWLMIAGQLEPRMPPEEEEPLTDAEKEVLQRWIESGAVGPQGAPMIRRDLQVPKVAVSAGVTKPLTAIAIAPNGQWTAEARGNQLTLRGAEGREVKLPDAAGKVLAINFSAQSDFMVIAGGLPGVFGEATLYRVLDGSPIHTFGEHRDVLYDAVMNPAGTQLATAGYDRVIRLWDIKQGTLLKSFSGHNGAVLDLDFSPDGTVLASASADNTAKLWSVESGERLDTLGQPQREALSIAFSPDGEHIALGSADNRLRIYRFTSRKKAAINPLIETRFADETPLVKLAFHPEGDRLVVVGQSGSVKVFDTKHWNQVAVLGKLEDLATSIAAGKALRIAQINGDVWEHAWGERPVSEVSSSKKSNVPGSARLPATGVPEREMTSQTKPIEVAEQEGNNGVGEAQLLNTPALVKGVVLNDGERVDEDWYRFHSRGGAEWMIEVNAARNKSKLDSVVEVRTVAGEPIERLRLQAVRDTYFTFRGKDGDTSDDFRVFAWEEMELNEYLYAAGEVTRLWLYPRGPDSGFKVYPGEGKRWTFFDTSPLAHALAEPAYIVKPLSPDERPIANGLPVFPLYYTNDDDSSRQWGADSRLRFLAPVDGDYLVRLRDARGQGGEDFKYELTIRPATPSYQASISAFDKPVPRGAGREFVVKVQRDDGFEGAVEVHITDLPRGVHATSPVIVEPGQLSAYGIIYADADAPIPEKPFKPTAYAIADIDGVSVKHEVGGWKEIKLSERPKVQVLVEPIDGKDELTSIDPKMLEGADAKPVELPETGPVATLPWTLRLKPSQTVAARLIVLRDGFEQRVEFGKEGAGRNLPFAVFVDNVGLNGLMVPEGASRRTFFITAAPVASPQRRFFYLKAEVDGGITSTPIVLSLEESDGTR